MTSVDIAKIKTSITKQWIKKKSSTIEEKYNTVNKTINGILKQEIQLSKDKVRTLEDLSSAEIKQILANQEAQEEKIKRKIYIGGKN